MVGLFPDTIRGLVVVPSWRFLAEIEINIPATANAAINATKINVSIVSPRFPALYLICTMPKRARGKPD